MSAGVRLTAKVQKKQARKLQAGMRECLIFRPKSEFQSVSIRKSVPERSFLDFCSRFIKKETQLKAGKLAAAAARASLSTCSTLAPLSHHASSNAPDSSDWTSCQVLRFSALFFYRILSYLLQAAVCCHLTTALLLLQQEN